MSQHNITLSWNRNGTSFGYKEYSRTHAIDFGHGVSIKMTAAPEYLGTAEIPDPEQAFVASLSSCHALTFFALCAFQKLTLDQYTDNAVGYLEKNETGKPVLARVELHPVTKFAEGTEVTAEQLEQLHHKAHQECFLANSVKTQITTVL